MQNRQTRTVGRLATPNKHEKIKSISKQKTKRDKNLSSIREYQSIDNARGMDIFDLVLDFGVLC